MDFNIAVQFNRVNISYGEKKILQDIEWTIKKGDMWALLGPNGAGKSTLLSLITADNPQAYSQPVVLFDRIRGSGESIWDIKKRIGLLSPELHIYFKQNITCYQAAGTGFVDTLFLNRSLTKNEKQVLDELFDFLLLDNLKDVPFLQISTGEQRKVLFIRAIIKNPELLILDEPFQAMDAISIQNCHTLLYNYCNSSKTLIFVTHRKEEIPTFVDKFFLIDEGKRVAT